MIGSDVTFQEISISNHFKSQLRHIDSYTFCRESSSNKLSVPWVFKKYVRTFINEFSMEKIHHYHHGNSKKVANISVQ